MKKETNTEFVVQIMLMVLFIGMFGLSCFTNTYLIGEIKDVKYQVANTIYESGQLKEELIDLRTALESNPDYLIALNRTEGKGGSYYTGSQNIVLYTGSRSPYIVGLDAHHEIGHYIWYEFFNDTLRHDYLEIYNLANEHISDYAETSVGEDFAETVSKSIVISINYSKIPEDRQEFVKQYAEELIIK